ncbi:hypothetical protein NHJ6243_009486 [Beauveria neobassiana]
MAGEDAFASPQGNLDDLDEEHRNSFIKALLRILHTEVAELTYSEILDGIPTSASYFDFYYQQEGHPAISHTELCPDVLDRTRQLRDQINPRTLHFSSSCKEVYLHSSLRNRAQTLYPPTPLQFDNLMRFLLSEAELGYVTPNPPLPILASADNRWRWDAWEAFSRFHIFRDRYEQRIKPTTTTKPRKDCPSVTDWPEIAYQLFLINAMYDRQAGKPVNENEVMAAKERLCQITPSSPVWNDDRPQQEPGPVGGRKEACGTGGGNSQEEA